ncbi:MAG: alginate export family protein [Phycisphaerales bacterium]|jgi:hypothetical protein|nr:alginate export family protein [Phycisphaerales bacterium]MBT7171438.1 alginate export family protein [Phycisphaerales bacterium]
MRILRPRLIDCPKLVLLALALLATAVPAANAAPAPTLTAKQKACLCAKCLAAGHAECTKCIAILRADKDLADTPHNLNGDWFAFGADLRYRHYSESNAKLTSSDKKTAQRFWHRPRVRVWTKIRPAKDLEIAARLVYEPRYWCKPDIDPQFTHNEAFFDQLYLKWSNALGLPLTITAGRQDIELGRGWLIREGTPLDGGRSFFFDAVRGTYVAKSIQTKFDLVYLKQYSDSAKIIKPFNDRNVHLTEQDETGVILYASNTSLKNTTLEGYFIYKHDEKIRGFSDSKLKKGNDSDLYTFGLRAAGKPSPHWEYDVEIAGQFGKKNDTRVCALATNNRVSYCFCDDWATKVFFDYEYRSGDDHVDGQFDMLWGRYTQFSNLYSYTVASLEGRTGANGSNFHRFGPGVAFKPTKDLYVSLAYNLMFRAHAIRGNTNPAIEQGSFRGHLFTAQVKYKLSKNVALRLLVDTMLPGNYYGKNNDVGTYVQTQVVIKL